MSKKKVIVLWKILVYMMYGDGLEDNRIEVKNDDYQVEEVDYNPNILKGCNEAVQDYYQLVYINDK